MLAIAAIHVALASGRVNGRVVLGRTTEQVETVFGRPRSVERYPVRRDLLFPGIEVIFGNGRTASAYVVTGVARPATLRAELAATDVLRESRRYHCDAKGCFGTFFTRDGARRVIYGMNRGRPYLGEQVWPQP